MESHIRTVVLLIVILFTIYALRRRGEMPAVIFIVFGPMAYFSQYVGVVLSPAKLIGLLFLIFVLFDSKLMFICKNKYLQRFLSYYVYTIILTIIMGFFWPDHSAWATSFMYGNIMRGYVQIAQIFMGLAIIVMIIDSIKSVNSFYTIQFALLATMAFLSVYGVYVWFAQSTGLLYNPINRVGGAYTDLNQVIITTVDAMHVIRAYSFSGEPKSLAVDASMGIILTYFTVVWKHRIFRMFGGQIGLTALFFVTIYLTYSTAGYLIFPLIFMVAFGAKYYVSRITKVTITKVTQRLFFFGIILITVAFVFRLDLYNKVAVMLGDRLVTRISQDAGMFTYAESAMFKFWADRPELILTGVGLGGSAFYIREFDTKSYEGFTAAPRGIVGFVGDRGFIGLWLFYYALAKASRVIASAARLRSSNRFIYLGVLVICLISGVLLLTKSGWYLEWLLVGLACAGATHAEREIRMIRAPGYARCGV